MKSPRQNTEVQRVGEDEETENIYNDLQDSSKNLGCASEIYEKKSGDDPQLKN